MRLLVEVRRKGILKVATAYLVVSWLTLEIGHVLFNIFELPYGGLSVDAVRCLAGMARHLGGHAPYGRYNYLFGAKLKTIALGVHPDVSLEKARTRHQVARTMLADGIDPSARKRATGVGIFGPLSPAGGA